MKPLQLVWFKRDLRVYDHAVLVEAARRGPVLPLYIAEPGYWSQPDASGRHWAFIAECLGALRADLAALGQPLMIRVGESIPVLSDLLNRLPIQAVWSHEETGNGWTYARDIAVGDLLRSRGIPLHELPRNGVVRRLETRNRWSKIREQRMRTPLEPPPVLRPLGALSEIGGLGDIPISCRSWRASRASNSRTCTVPATASAIRYRIRIGSTRGAKAIPASPSSTPACVP